MRLTILKDYKISGSQMDELSERFSKIYRDNVDIDPVFFIEEHNFDEVPLQADPDGDLKPTPAYFTHWTDDVFSRYGNHGTDHVVFLVHEDNWVFKNIYPGKKGIWGQNWSNIYHGYQVELCRFDRDTMSNSVGTLYHEVHHSHDAFIAAMLGINVERMLGIESWDREITHGGGEGWSYIRDAHHNTESLQYIAPWLREAYQKRRTLFAKDLTTYQEIIATLQRTIWFIRKELNRRGGVQ